MGDTVKVTAFHSCQKDFEQFFIMQIELNACKNVKVLMAAMIIWYNLEEWWPFMDSSLQGLRAVLLHKGKILLSIPVAYIIYKEKTWKLEGNFQLCELQDISIAHLWWFEGNCHFDGTANGYTDSFVSCGNRVVVPKVFAAVRRTCLYISHVHLD